MRHSLPNARGQPLTRFGVWYLLRKHIAAGHQMATLRDKRIPPAFGSAQHSDPICSAPGSTSRQSVIGSATRASTPRCATLEPTSISNAKPSPKSSPRRLRHHVPDACSSTGRTSSVGCAGCRLVRFLGHHAPPTRVRISGPSSVMRTVALSPTPPRPGMRIAGTA